MPGPARRFQWAGADTRAARRRQARGFGGQLLLGVAVLAAGLATGRVYAAVIGVIVALAAAVLLAVGPLAAWKPARSWRDVLAQAEARIEAELQVPAEPDAGLALADDSGPALAEPLALETELGLEPEG